MNKFLFWLAIFAVAINYNGFSTKINPLIKKDREFLQRFVINDPATQRPMVGQKKFISPNKIFMIHYDTVGVHSVTNEDKNQNGVSDYVDSVAFYFEKAYFFQVDELGMKSPHPDDGTGGGNEYDIYLWDLGNCDEPDAAFYHDGGAYGFTYPYKDIIGNKFTRSYSYIVIDNDFSPKDSAGPQNQPFKRVPAYKETGINALKITAIHELHHAIQFRYGYSNPTNLTIMEMSSMGMEFTLYPESIDYLQHTNRVLQNLSIYPFGIDNQDTGYGFSILNQYFLENFPNVNIIKRLWELVESGVEVYGALDGALKEQGSSLGTVFNDFIDWIYFTGAMAKENEYLWHAKDISAMKFYSTQNYKSIPLSSSGRLKPYEMRGIRFIIESGSGFTNDTIDFVLANQDLKSASTATVLERDYYISLSNQNTSNSIKVIGFDDLYLLIDTDELIANKYYVNKGTKTITIEHTFPNPYNINKDEELYFPVPSKTMIGSSIILKIFSAEMLELYSFDNLKTGLKNNQLCVFLNSNDIINMNNGIYFFSVDSGDESIFGKFSVINK